MTPSTAWATIGASVIGAAAVLIEAGVGVVTRELPLVVPALAAVLGFSPKVVAAPAVEAAKSLVALVVFTVPVVVAVVAVASL